MTDEEKLKEIRKINESLNSCKNWAIITMAIVIGIMVIGFIVKQ